jgi:hypothetical protein
MVRRPCSPSCLLLPGDSIRPLIRPSCREQRCSLGIAHPCLPLFCAGMAWQNNFDFHFLSTDNGRVEVVNLKPFGLRMAKLFRATEGEASSRQGWPLMFSACSMNKLVSYSSFS